ADHVSVITHADPRGFIAHLDHVAFIAHVDPRGFITHARVSANIHLSALSYVLCTAFLPPPASLNRPPRPLRPVWPLRQVRPSRPPRPARPVPPPRTARPSSTRAGGARPDDQLGCHSHPAPGRDRPGHPVDKRTQRLPAKYAEVLPHGSQRRQVVPSLGHVVEADDADVAGYPQASLGQRPDDAERHRVVAAEDG